MASAARLLLYGLLIWAPLLLGANRPVAWVLNGAVIAVIMALFLVGEIGSGGRRHIDWRPVAWASAGLAIWIAWMVVQALPGLPRAFHHPVWSTLAGELPPHAGAISVSASATWTTIAVAVPAALLSVVAMRIATDGRRAEHLLDLLVFATTVVAAYGLIARYVGFRQVFLLEEVAYEGVVTGTFVGRSAAATYFVVGLAVAASLLAARVEERIDGSTRGSTGAAEALFRSGPYLLACAVLGAAILNTASRGGAVAAAAALLTVSALFLLRTAVRRLSVGLVLLAGVAILATVTLVSSTSLLERLRTGVGGGNRIQVFADTIGMIAARPLLGHGAGAFAEAFPLFHDTAPPALFWNRAHSTYLQTAAELGLPVFAILSVTILGVLACILREAARRTGARPAAIAAAGAAVAVGLQAVADFSVQIQAIGLTLSVLIGAGLGQAVVRRETVSPGRTRGEAADPRQNAPVETVYVSVPAAAADEPARTERRPDDSA